VLGYAGVVLFVDLSTGVVKKEPLDCSLVDHFIGGIGACARLAYDFLVPDVEPLSEENTIIIGTGILTGTSAPGCSKIPLMTKWPATGIIEAGSVGSAFGPNLKWAGYDFLIIKGKSKDPVYLLIEDEDVRLCSAVQYWGRDIYETTDELWQRHGEDSAVLAIGQAGENLVKTSIALVDKVSTIGKGGLGALMGYKKLKAIVVRGRKGFKIKDNKTFNKLALELIKRMLADPNHKLYVKLGRMSRFENWAEVIGWPHRNVRMKCPKEITDLFRPERYVKEVMKDRLACPTCVTGCKDHIQVREGRFKGLETFVSSLYGRIMNWGSRCMVGGYPEAMKCQDFCNRTGLCVHSFTALMDWAVDLYEHGVITKADTGGLELRRGFDTTMDLMHKTVRREGFGAVLAEGWLGAMKIIGRGCEKYAIQVKGIEPLFDPRLHRLGTVEFYQITNPRGGWGSRGRSASYIQKNRPIEEFVEWCKRTGVPDEAMSRIFQRNRFNVGRLTKYAEDWCYLVDTMGGPCLEGRVVNHYDLDLYEKLYDAAVGRGKSKEEIKKAGERAFVMIKVLNARIGFARKDDRPPDRWFEPIEVDGEEQVLMDYYGVPLGRDDVERLLDEYYEERGFDPTTGLPTAAKLADLGLAEIVASLRSEKGDS